MRLFLTNLLTNLLETFISPYTLKNKMKKYLLLIEDEKLWEKFKQTIQKDINSEIMELIKEKVKKR